MLAVNKAEGMASERAVAEFHELGLGDPIAISSAHGDNVPDLVEEALDRVPSAATEEDEATAKARPSASRSRWSAGPNVGKSTLSTRCSAKSA